MAAVLRVATEADAAAIAAIYAPYVLETAISFELEPPSEAEMRARLRGVLDFGQWLVCDDGGELVGYAHAGRFHPRAAYQWTVETTVYVARERHRRGVGRALYAALLESLRVQGFTSAVAIIALPNEPSVALHEALGFTPVGVLGAVGHKLGAWRDVGWWQLELAAPVDAPRPPRRFVESAPGEQARVLSAGAAFLR